MDEVAYAPFVDAGPARRQQALPDSPCETSAGEPLLGPPSIAVERDRLRALAIEESNGQARRNYRRAWSKIMARVEPDETLRALLLDLDAAVVDLAVECQDQVLDRVVIGLLLDGATPNVVDLRTTRRTRILARTCVHDECHDALHWLSVAQPPLEEDPATSPR
jgi:hypothetical protein